MNLHRRWALGLTLMLLAVGAAAPAAAFGAIGAISGTVSAPGPVDEVEVCVVEAKPSEKCVYPGAGGGYLITDLEPGIYRVEFLPSYQSHLVAQYYNHRAKLSEADPVVVKTGPPPGPIKTPNINANLELGGVIEGTATDALSSAALEDVEVCALGAASGLAAGCTHSDASGHYAIPALPPGSYKVGFWGEQSSAAYAPQFYDEEASFFEATSIAVVAAGTLTGIDAQLFKGARVQGTVSDAASGTRLTGIAVCVLQVGAAKPERCAISGAGGEYTLPGVASGSYELAFSPEFNEFAAGEFVLPEEDGYRTQFYSGAATRAEAKPLALTAPATVSGVDAHLLSTHESAPPSPPPPTLSSSTAAAIAPAPVAKKKPKKCKRGFKKRKVKGTVRCVKVHKHHRKRHGKQGGQQKK
jgi:hypothetical protein